MRSTLFFAVIHACTISLFMAFALWAQSGPPPPQPGRINIDGTLKGVDGEPIRDGKITVKQGETILPSVTDSEGKFRISRIVPGEADVTYEARGYESIEEKHVQITTGTDLSKTLRSTSVGGVWSLLLLIPGVFGLLVAWWKEGRSQSAPDDNEVRDRLLVALVNGLIWGSTLGAIWYFSEVSKGVHSLQLFHHNLTFEFYVPLLGFFGSLLYVFDLFRGQEKDTFKGKEFGMRIIMGPYVAIIIVALFGKDLDFVDFTSHTGQGTLAFLSGLLVVAFLQGVIERTNEFLGRWRRSRIDYRPSPLAEKFGLSQEEDLAFRKVAIRFPEQLESRDIEELKSEAKDAGFDEQLAVTLKRRLQHERFRQEVGQLIWTRLAEKGVETTAEFARVTDATLQGIAQVDPEVDFEALKTLRDEAKTIE